MIDVGVGGCGGGGRGNHHALTAVTPPPPPPSIAGRIPTCRNSARDAGKSVD